jgi:hypothetical protein
MSAHRRYVALHDSWRANSTDPIDQRFRFLGEALDSGNPKVRRYIAERVSDRDGAATFVQAIDYAGIKEKCVFAFGMDESFLDRYAALIMTPATLSSWADAILKRPPKKWDVYIALSLLHSLTIISPYAPQAWILLAICAKRGLRLPNDTRDHAWIGLNECSDFQELRTLPRELDDVLERGIQQLDELVCAD